jgi:hypothetical protein
VSAPDLPPHATIEALHAAMSPGLPYHEDEIFTSHEGQPSIAEQDRTHGAGLPAVDRG